MDNIKHTQWTGKTGGQTWMQRSLVLLFSYCDIRIGYFIMGWTIPFYMLFNRRGYLSSYRFYRKRFGYGPLKSFWSVYLNQFTFGEIILDRFAVYAGKTYQIDIEGRELFEQFSSSECGFLQLSSHIGNYELAGYSLSSKSKRFNALVFGGETQTVMDNRAKQLSKNNIRMIAVQEDMSHLFIISNALRDGEIVSMPGDRIFGSQKFVSCDFLGEPAKFPLGPFALAIQREVPILLVFVMKVSAEKYKICISPLALSEADKEKPKKEQMQLLAKSFAAKLEKVVREYPLQWFNFYDFWE